MSYDLAVLALDASADTAAAQAMFARCSTRNHPEGELDERIAAFYEELRARFPDYPPCDEQTPWTDMPLSTGIDHVIMHLSLSARSDPALRAITELAEKHRLVIYDPQSSDATMPGRQPGS